jgi:uncharacterized protein with GYD domain
MPTFIVLSTLTDDGAETLVKNPERSRGEMIRGCRKKTTIELEEETQE